MKTFHNPFNRVTVACNYRSLLVVSCLVIANVNVTKGVLQECQKYRIWLQQMCSFKLQMHQNLFSPTTLPQTPCWGNLQCAPELLVGWGGGHSSDGRGNSVPIPPSTPLASGSRRLHSKAPSMNPWSIQTKVQLPGYVYVAALRQWSGMITVTSWLEFDHCWIRNPNWSHLVFVFVLMVNCCWRPLHKAQVSVVSDRIGMIFDRMDCSSHRPKCVSTDAVAFSIWRHSFKMAAMTSHW